MTDYPASTYVTVAENFLAANDLDASLQAALRGQARYPDDPRMKIAIARVHMAAGRFAGALLPLHQAEALDPSSLPVWLLLAECNNRRDDTFEAERYYQKVLALDPAHVEAIVNLEPILREQGRYGEVRTLLARLQQRLPGLKPSITTSLACLDLADGKLAAGFRGYEDRIEGFGHLKEAYGTAFYPRWDGKEDLTGLSVLMRFEQGLGDTIQFARFASTLKDRGASHVCVLCKEPLHRLLLTNPAVDAVIGRIDASQRFDREVMMMSMPALLGLADETDIPGSPYLSVNPTDKAFWQDKLTVLPRNKPKVGLVWSGELKRGQWFTERMNLRRSIPLESFRPLFDADCSFVSLQKGERQADLTTFVVPRPLHDFMHSVGDFYDTACLIANLDLVIAVDTSTAHVAGALGKPVWMLSRLDGCWRWMQDRADSPWYPSMSIYRQTIYCDWRPTIRAVAEDLIRFSRQENSEPSNFKSSMVSNA